MIDDREGLPITLSVLYIELGRRLELEIEGVNMPRHFLVRHLPAKGKSQLIDVYEGGKLLAAADAGELARDFLGRDLEDDDLARADKQEIVLRMLGNLLGIAEDDQQTEAMLRYLEAMLAVEPELVRERGMRAVLRAQTGRRDAAVADLDYLIQKDPPGIDLEKLREMRDVFSRQ